MPCTKDIPCCEGLFFVTFSCYKWQQLIDQTNSYDLVYSWFDYLKKQNHRIAGYVIMPNHLHALIDFSATAKKINTIIGDGKRFMAYRIVKRPSVPAEGSRLPAGRQGILAQLVPTSREQKALPY